jgi:hypothetical protein
LLLVHWNAVEAESHATRLRRAGHEVTAFSDPRGGGQLRQVRSNLPDAFIVVLDRQPMLGRAVGQSLRQQKATRNAPLIFVGGEPGKVAKVRSILPDAAYTTWPKLGAELKRALTPRSKPSAPLVVPGTMAGYAGTPLPKKLGIRAGVTVMLLGAPEGFEATLGTLPEGVTLRDQARETAEVVVQFVRSRADFERRFGIATRTVATGGRLWIAWPKKTSGLFKDLTETDVRAHGLAHQWVDYKICAIDATWSGLCFARRKGGA